MTEEMWVGAVVALAVCFLVRLGWVLWRDERERRRRSLVDAEHLAVEALREMGVRDATVARLHDMTAYIYWASKEGDSNG